MDKQPSIWQRMGIQDWFLTSEKTTNAKKPQSLTPDDVYNYVIAKFNDSVRELSFAGRVVFYHEYIISFNPEDYQEFMNNKQGIFGLIVNETVKKFYEQLKQYRLAGKTVVPSSSKWVFRLVSHPDYARGDIGFIGKLLPGNSVKKEENLRVTFIPRQTGIAQTFDVSQDVLKGFNYYSEGYYELPYEEDLEPDQTAPVNDKKKVLARFETILPEKQFAGKKVEYLMKDDEIIVSGNEEEREGGNIFKIPTEWVNSPHLQIRYNKSDGKFYLASFGERTILNENDVERSDVNAPAWVELPVNSRILLNGIVGVNIFKS
ncbi:hypothetical protein [Mucilaginibacter myungsuensis]|uniref:FHA domain-containing protein n=1 Tax=Mucilaginibacter myungsuensis TaxID=649104 RepID=A0A929PYV0_9SPHI|nr:hypothetical protein [Mucilaginibacter myungsuensis]MBE9663712.1 hypothetical protein [Mucilaginibacter myungsuensis]MDN3598964.1 hypothetical protein [Mucilaginibacter myungsuensis]